MVRRQNKGISPKPYAWQSLAIGFFRLPVFCRAPMVKPMPSPSPVSVIRPEQQSLPVVLSCPHAGTILPDALRRISPLSDEILLRATDFGVRELLDPAVQELSVPMVACEFSRAYCDVNRYRDELDPGLFEDGSTPPPHRNRSPRVLAGLGVIPTLIGGTLSIYGDQRLSPEAVEQRLDTVHRAYHDALTEQLKLTCERFGHAILIDCHSMPGLSPSATRGLRRDRNPFRLRQVPGEGEGLSTGAVDAVLGDRFGTTCAKPVVLSVLHRLWHSGLIVEWNRPYAGGFVVQHHGAPQNGVHALQVELSRDLYLDDGLGQTENHGAVTAMVQSLIERLGALDPAVLQDPSLYKDEDSLV